MKNAIRIDDVAEILKMANEYGYPAMLYINGEYYNIDFREKEEKRNDRKEK